MKKHLFIFIFLFTSILFNAQNFTWAKTIGGGGTTGYSGAYCIKLDATGNMFVAGIFNSTCYFDLPTASYSLGATAGGHYDVFIAKYDNTGTIMWAKKLGGPLGEHINAMELDAGGNIYVAGTFSGTADFNPDAGVNNLTSSSSQDIFIAKYDNSGSYVWAKKIGATADEYVNTLKLDAAGNIFIGGTFQQTVDFDPGAATAPLTSNGFDDFFIARYDNNGNYVWAKNIGGGNNDQCNALRLDATGNLLVTGFFQGVSADFDPGPSNTYLISYGTQDIYVAKYDNNGNYVWAKNMGGTGNTSYNTAYTMETDATGHIYLAGSFGGTFDFDPSTTTASTLISTVGNTGFLAKYDANGNYLWVKNTGGAAINLKLSNGGKIYATGNFGNTVDFDPSANIVNLVSNGYADIFISTYDNSGNYLAAKKMGGISNDTGIELQLDAQENLYVAGYYQYMCDFDPGPATSNLSAYGTQDAFITKFTGIITGVNETMPSKINTILYPNPFNDKTVLAFELNSGSDVDINLFNALGQNVATIKSGYLESGAYSFDINAATNGIYFLQLSVNGISHTQKIIKAE